MRTIRRVGGLAVAGLLLSSFVGGPAASADTPASYIGSASGQALKLAGLNQTLTAGASEAKASSDGTSSATGSGSVSPAGAFGVVKAANPPGETKPEACGATIPPAPLNTLLTLGLGCGQASATGSGTATVASATGEVGDLDVSLQTVIPAALLPVVGTVTTTVGTTIGTVCAALPNTVVIPGVPSLRDACTAVNGTVAEVVQSVTSTKTLDAELGSSASGVSVNGTTVTSESTASGAIIRVLPLAVLNGTPVGEPLATITVARANAKVLCDLNSGTATPSFDPALVRVKLAAPIVALLPAIPDLLPKITLPGGLGEVDANVSQTNGEFTVTPGAKVLLFAGLPIQTEIVAGAGTATKNPDGSATAVADGVKVHALQLAPAPLTNGLLFDLAHAEAAGACKAAVVETPRAGLAPPEIPAELPRTGGTPWMPVVGLAGLALFVVTRRALVRSN